MKKVFLLGLIIFSTGIMLAQEIALADTDTVIYEVLEEMPRFPACEGLDTTIQAKTNCAQRALLAFMNQNIVYPLEARQKNASGMVVVKFVVEKNGSITSPEILKDVEGGCGLEVLRIVGAMNQAGVRWVPGKLKGQAVRAYFTLPIRFKLTEAPPYIMIGQDSVWVQFDTPLSFEGGDEALTEHLMANLKYPESGIDTCAIGKMEIKLLVDRQGKVRVLDMTDLNNLGFDFWFAATNAVTSTIGKWKVATFQEKRVPASYDITLSFVPKANSCQTIVDRYNSAIQIINEGAKLYNEGEIDPGLEKMSSAVDMFPSDAEFLMIRGQAYLDNNDFSKACEDLTKVKNIATVDWYDDLLRLICKASPDESNE